MSRKQHLLQAIALADADLFEGDSEGIFSYGVYAEYEFRNAHSVLVRAFLDDDSDLTVSVGYMIAF